MYIPRLLLAAPRSGEGKTSVTAALLSAFTARGLRVFPYKVGPDYIDPAFHRHVTGRPSRNLDSWLLSEDALLRLFLAPFRPNRGGQADERADAQTHVENPSESIAVIEGVMGLFDGQGLQHEGSTAHTAKIVSAPVLLVVNGKGMSRSVAALVAGYAHFHPQTSIAGVIFNRLAGDRQYRLLREAVQEYTGIPCFGFLPDNPHFHLPSRHLGLIPAEEVADLRQRLADMAEAAQTHMDIQGLLHVACAAAPLDCPAPSPATAARYSPARPLRIGIARDAAFSFYYQDGLDLLIEPGAELVPFSPLLDAALPERLDGLYLGGGFPDVFAAQLEANTAFRAAIRRALEQGLPAYAECGGMLYLTEHLTTASGTMHAMAGFLPCRCRMTPGLRNFGYVTVTTRCASPLGPAGFSYRAHEFHYSEIDPASLPPTAKEVHPNAQPEYGSDTRMKYPVCSVQRPDGGTWEGGMMRKNVFAAYPHLHFCSSPEAAAAFLAFCRDRKHSPAA